MQRESGLLAEELHVRGLDRVGELVAEMRAHVVHHLGHLGFGVHALAVLGKAAGNLTVDGAAQHGVVQRLARRIGCGAGCGRVGAGGLQAQIKQGLSLKGEKVVIAGSGPLLLAVADTVNKAGGDVTNIIEQAPLPALLRFAGGLWRWPQKLRQLATLAPKGYLSGAQTIRAHGATRLEAVTLRQRGVERTIACDRLAIGYGLVPNIETGLLFGCATAQEAIQVNRWQETSIADVYAAGECTGFGGSELALVEGEIAGYAAAGASQQAQARFARRARWQRFAAAINRTFQLAESLKNAATPESLLCRCEDVRCGDVAAADDWLQAKLTQRCGMGACQGRTCAASARWLYGWPLPQPREPLSPARAETLIALARLSAEP